MNVTLKVIAGRNAGQELRITGPKFFIGRADDCHLRPHSELISRHHCGLIVEGRSVTVRDFGSRNGTFVNGDRVGSARELNDGDILKVGPLEFTVFLAERVAPKRRLAVNSIKEIAARIASDAVGDDADVSNWQSAEERVLDESETGVANAHETEEVVMEDTRIGRGKGIPAAPGSEQPGERKPPGKLPPPPVSSPDSFAAAADMLRKMRKR